VIVAELEARQVDKQIEIVSEMATHGCNDPVQCSTLSQLLDELIVLYGNLAIANQGLEEDIAERDAAEELWDGHCDNWCHLCTNP